MLKRLASVVSGQVVSGQCRIWPVWCLAGVVSGKILRSTALIHFGRPEQSPGICGRSLPDLKNPVDSFSATRIFGLLAVSLPNEDSGSDIQNRFSSKHSGSMRTNFQFPKHRSAQTLFTPYTVQQANFLLAGKH